jgi:hypothetical protein
LKPALKSERWNLKSELADLSHRSKLWVTFWDRHELEEALTNLE